MNKLFIYGTIKEPSIQLSLFGRICEMKPARLIMHNLSYAIHSNGEVSKYLTIVYTPNDINSIVEGYVIDVNDDDLIWADIYESIPNLYRRISVSVFQGDNMQTCYTYMNTHYYRNLVMSILNLLLYDNFGYIQSNI